MKILFVSYWFPAPPDNGSRIRIYNFLKALSKDHNVFLVSMLQDDSDPKNAKYLDDVCTVVSLHQARIFNPKSVKSQLAYFSKRPRSFVDNFDPTVKADMKDAIRKINPDVIVVSTLQMADYVLDDLTIPSVLIDHNCEFAVLKRNQEYTEGRIRQWRYKMGWKKLARWETYLCRNFSAVVLPTEEDKKKMLDFAPDLTNIHVIPNGVDIDHYDPTKWQPDENRLVYNGALAYAANLHAVYYFSSEIYPLLSRRLPKIKLFVTGNTNGIDLQKILSWPGIELTGYVEDIRSVLYGSTICAVPLRIGGGMRLKIPEAMAAGVPVVSTSMGAEGLDGVDNEHLLIADTPDEFAIAVERLIKDPDLACHLRQNARELMESQYSWKILGRQFVDLVEKVGKDTHIYA